MTFHLTSYFRCVRKECSQVSYRPGLSNPVHYRCPFCGGELITTRAPNLKPEAIPLAISRSSVIVQTITRP